MLFSCEAAQRRRPFGHDSSRESSNNPRPTRRSGTTLLAFATERYGTTRRCTVRRWGDRMSPRWNPCVWWGGGPDRGLIVPSRHFARRRAVAVLAALGICTTYVMAPCPRPIVPALSVLALIISDCLARSSDNVPRDGLGLGSNRMTKFDAFGRSYLWYKTMER